MYTPGHASKTFWLAYSGHLAPLQAVLAGGAAAALVGALPPRRTLVAGLLVVVGVATPLPRALALGRLQFPEVAALGRLLEAEAARDCVVGLDPTWLLLANRLPGDRKPGTTLVDSYGFVLVEAMRAGAGGTSLEATQAPAAQLRLRAMFEGCWVVLGSRGWQLDETNRAWLETAFEVEGPGGNVLEALRPRRR